MVSDGALLMEGAKITGHLIHAEAEHFSDSEYAIALRWLKSEAVSGPPQGNSH